MNDELYDLVGQAASITDDEVAVLPVSGAERELMEEIMSTPMMVKSEVTSEPPPSRRWPRIAAAAVAAAAVAVAGLWLPLSGGDSPAHAAELVKVAEANARLLVGEPGWKVTQVAEFSVATGDMTFSKGKRSLFLHWRSAESYQSYLDDRALEAKRTRIEVLRESGWMFQYNNTTDFTTILPPRGANFLEIRSNLGSEQAYRNILGTLRQVDVQTWLDALPVSTVKPDQRAKALADILKGIPVPPGFDRGAIEDRGVGDRYQLGAQVTGAVACGWIDHWRKGGQSGDERAVEEAVAAMRTARSWPILREMDPQGGWSDNLWQVADAIVDGSLARVTQMSGKPRPLPTPYQVTCEHLGLR